METVIGAFDRRDVAYEAVLLLAQSGFDRSDIYVQEQARREATQAPRPRNAQWAGVKREVAVERGVLASIGHFFTSLFGQDDPAGRAGTYGEAVRRGYTVVVVDAKDAAQARSAAELLHEAGAFDVDERAQEWRAAGWDGRDASVATGASATTGGVHVFPRDAQVPVLRDVVAENDLAAPAGRSATRVPDRATGTPAQRERAFASDRSGDAALNPRDPDATVPGIMPGGRTRPDRNNR